MSTFEKTYQIDPERESKVKRERHYSIELSDQDHLAKLSPPIIKPSKEKHEKSMAEEIEMPTKFLNSKEKHEKSTSKSTTKKSKKVPSKSNKAAMARLQKKL